MFRFTTTLLVAGLILFGAVNHADAQSFTTDDPILPLIWEEGMERSQVYPLAQVLLDSLGPRLTGTPQKEAAHTWAVATLQSWGVEAENQQYGTWRGWERGITHVDLISPRIRSLNAIALAWSPPTPGTVEGAAVSIPESDFDTWVEGIAGSFVLISFPQPTCRPDANWREHGTEASFERMREARSEAQAAWGERISNAGFSSPAEMIARLEEAGAAGIVTSMWATGWGAERIFGAQTQSIPTVSLSCEDYGLVARLAEHNQSPTLRVNVEATILEDQPTFNSIGTIRGTELPDEYVLLSAHFDSWDGASGATDNGTGTVMMMEVIRILQEVYPNPRRTIIIALWGGEEQGLNGSRAFTEDYPEIVENIHVVFNQDNGTGRIRNISMNGFTQAASYFADWFAQIPGELVGEINIGNPGMPSGGGSDHASFVCNGAPAFFLSATNWDYFSQTWHTNTDTLDKLVFDDLRQNAVLGAMLTYLASEDDEPMPRTRRTVFPQPNNPNIQPGWPECRPAARSFSR